jgi:endogenous inhibitor of DNA gyrase (YacG/DUF329 family)
MTDKIDKVTCPTCGKNGTWTPSNTFRPFCSDRCKLIDLGEWAAEKHAIPGEPTNLNGLEMDMDDESDNE